MRGAFAEYQTKQHPILKDSGRGQSVTGTDSMVAMGAIICYVSLLNSKILCVGVLFNSLANKLNKLHFALHIHPKCSKNYQCAIV